MANSPYPSISLPEATSTSLLQAVLELKAVVEILCSEKRGRAQQTYIQRETPEDGKLGDLWIKPAALAGELFNLSYWNGKTWINVVLA